MTERNILAAGILAFLLLASFCIWHHTAGMTAGPMPGAHSGPAAGTHANLPAPRFGLSVSNGKVTLTGTVPDEAAKTQLIQKANEVYGAGNYIDEIKVAAPGTVAATTPDWMNRALGLMAFGKDKNLSGSLELSGKSLTATGLVPDETAKTKLATDLKALVGPDVKYTDRITLGLAGTGPAPTPEKALSEEEAQVQQSLDEQLKLKIIEFEPGKADITPQGIVVLGEILPALQAAKDNNIEIGGHTDNQGNPQKNQELSQRRADTVRQHLVDKGINGATLTAKGYGPSRPVADNKKPEGRQRNRRIEFKVLAK